MVVDNTRQKKKKKKTKMKNNSEIYSHTRDCMSGLLSRKMTASFYSSKQKVFVWEENVNFTLRLEWFMKPMAG